MGLDLFAHKTLDAIYAPVDLAIATALELHYWRKHPNLHGWMQRLCCEKGGQQEFNCTPVVLTTEDLDRVERDLVAGKLPETAGLFFGESDGSETENGHRLDRQGAKGDRRGLHRLLRLVVVTPRGQGRSSLPILRLPTRWVVASS
ncbi:hypothetical protein [Botrimarina mediterranea]|uniref:Uncharacterized protein n=1 Tax=Botrimarina mediterranea TaxID=2528022 RepID=A0A518K8K0_9BACT|nr:hypothetical protein [Botrimarina mediterranea]QDV74109.1 hypothetical protein Spa11_23080 [Botrimarina mediterranea]QDV78739.1 hypothetical protein K2D_23460 [Planctomycetes bacterium K2D]